MIVAYARKALRTRALTLSVCTTGSTTLAATTTGYTRASGSFLADGFRRGMELSASGFGTAANNGLAVVTGVTALALAVTAYDVSGDDVTARTLATEAAGAGRTLSVGLPALRSWEGEAFDPTPGYPWVEEQLLGGPSRRIGVVTGGRVESRPEYVFRVHVPDASGTAGAYAADAYTDALAALFAPGQAMSMDDGETLRVRGDTGPSRGQYRILNPGFGTVPFAIPLRTYVPMTTT